MMIDLRRNITLGATNLNTGEYTMFNETLGNPGIMSAAMASSAIPGFFQFQKNWGEVWVDGGTIYMNDYFSAINRCLEVTGGVQEDVILDSIECMPVIINDLDKDMNSVEILLRHQMIRAYDYTMFHFYWALAAFPKVNFRYIIRPSGILDGLPLDFTKADLEKWYKHGQEQAKKAIDGQISVKDVLEEYKKARKMEFAY